MPFVKGQSGNPDGRPKGVSFAAVLAEQLEAERAGKTTRDRLAAVVVDKALKGDLEAIKWIVDRVDGKTPDRLDANVHADLGLPQSTLEAILAEAARSRALPGGAE